MNKKYIEYLLRNAYRLEKDLLKEGENKLDIREYLNKEEQIKLVKDVLTTINFYNSLDIVYKEAMLLRYVKNYLIKEVAEKTHFSQSHLKAIFKECKSELAEKISA
ncbi:MULTISPECIES: hypothetical protein [unclassified Gemella]|uniref:hypothetical protein n=1 Tax=unclassified Gemella TaxID=2624949 RepID=UPI001C055A6E|nr:MULTISPECIES: hypothetical protein [unclassified Gemella]MBU0278188.1 hypothetical protein [Gemella sp. zg-1178]QWQ38854.1 hypothetical protein KMP11_00360 [Gemella sp. zg-570]